MTSCHPFDQSAGGSYTNQVIAGSPPAQETSASRIAYQEVGGTVVVVVGGTVVVVVGGTVVVVVVGGTVVVVVVGGTVVEVVVEGTVVEVVVVDVVVVVVVVVVRGTEVVVAGRVDVVVSVTTEVVVDVDFVVDVVAGLDDGVVDSETGSGSEVVVEPTAAASTLGGDGSSLLPAATAAQAPATISRITTPTIAIRFTRSAWT